MDDWKSRAVWDFVPAHLRHPLTRYVDEGVNPGCFLEAFFSNNLLGALEHADFASRRRLYDIAEFINNFVPAVCCGDRKSFENWIEIGGMAGFQAARNSEAA
jgi:hypothetical protein